MELLPQKLSPIIFAACKTLGISVDEAFKLINCELEEQNLDELPINVWIRFCNLVFLPYDFYYHGYSQTAHLMELQRNSHRLFQNGLPQTEKLKELLNS